MSDQLVTLLQDNAVVVALLFIIAIWFFVLRTRATKIESNEEFTGMIGSGQPVVLEFFSNL